MEKKLLFIVHDCIDHWDGYYVDPEDGHIFDFIIHRQKVPNKTVEEQIVESYQFEDGYEFRETPIRYEIWG